MHASCTFKHTATENTEKLKAIHSRNEYIRGSHGSFSLSDWFYSILHVSITHKYNVAVPLTTAQLLVYLISSERLETWARHFGFPVVYPI